MVSLESRLQGLRLQQFGFDAQCVGSSLVVRMTHVLCTCMTVSTDVGLQLGWAKVPGWQAVT
jgi:hypothetical protein